MNEEEMIFQFKVTSQSPLVVVDELLHDVDMVDVLIQW